MPSASTNDVFEGLWISGEAHLGTGRRSHPRAGSVVTVFADRGVRICDPVLLASGGGSKWAEAIALGVVIGEPGVYKNRNARRDVLILKGFNKLRIPLTKPIASGSLGRSADEAEMALVRKQLADLGDYQFVLEASHKARGSFKSAKTSEENFERFVAELMEACSNHLESASAFTVGRQLRMPGDWKRPSGWRPVAEAEAGATKSYPRADLVAHTLVKGKDHVLVIEVEWSKVAAFESAAQAYEYASRLKDKGHLAEGKDLFDLAPSVVRKAKFHPLVVANDARVNNVQKALKVEAMDLAGLVKRLRKGQLI